ncbi:hypothetical protein [Streptomyces sp. NPDC001508]
MFREAQSRWGLTPLPVAVVLLRSGELTCRRHIDLMRVSSAGCR